MSGNPRCTWDTTHGWLSPEHRSDCNSHTCAGCRPCAKTHCGMRGKCAGHVDIGSGIRTCPSCIGRTRNALRKIENLHALALPREAEETGVDSEALNLAGPAALPEHVDFRRGYCEFPREHDDQHPYAVLGRWDLALRETYGPGTDLTITVSRAVAYLTGLLAGRFPHDDEFEEFAASIASCLTHMEAVLHDSRTPERGRPCPRCAEASEDGKGPRLRKRYAEGDDKKTKAGANDTWHCPVVAEHWWSEEDYRNRVEADYEKHAKKLTASGFARAHGIPESTVRTWSQRELIRKRGTDSHGRVLYSVDEVLAIRDGTVLDSGALT